MARLWDSGALYGVWGGGQWSAPAPHNPSLPFDAQGALDADGGGASFTVFLRGGGTVSAVGGFYPDDEGNGRGDFDIPTNVPGPYHPDSHSFYAGDGSHKPIHVSVSGHTPVGGAASEGNPPFWAHHMRTVETGVTAPTGLVPSRPVPTQPAAEVYRWGGRAFIHDFGPITDPTARLVAVYVYPDFPWIGGTVENTLVPLGGAVVTPMDVPISFFGTPDAAEGLTLPSRHGLLGIRTATGMKYVPFLDPEYSDFFIYTN